MFQVLRIFAIGFVAIIIVAVYSACRVSGTCSRAEEEAELKHKQE